MKILVTGATGFIGNHLVMELLRLGHQVIASSKNIEKCRTFGWFPKVKYVPYDIHIVRENLFHFFKEPDLAIHLAWEGLPNYKDLFHVEQNLLSHYFFLKNLIEGGLKKLVVTGTCYEHGMQCGELNENMPTNPNTAYSLAKDTLRKILEQLKKNVDFSFIWIRLFFLYGEGQNPNSLIPQLLQSIQGGQKIFNMSGGEQLRDYLEVHTASEYIAKISTQNRVQGVVNCCSGKPISIRKIVENYLKETNQSIKLNLNYYPYPDYEPMAYWGNTDKLRTILKD